MNDANLIDKLRRGLAPTADALLSSFIAHANRKSMTTFLVGGPVRDLLLGVPSVDLDIVVEGDAIALARGQAENVGARLRTHPAFLTASVSLNGIVLDLATARHEFYAQPGALPTVSAASIHEDLLRRDFTVDAMAIGLTGHRRGRVLDPCGGREDLKAGRIRVLHKRSFRDDATRILRAFRYACRLGFTIEPQTMSWLQRDVTFLQSIGAARLRQELSRMLREATPEPSLLALDEHGVLAAIHPALRFERAHARAFSELRRINPKAAPAAYWSILAWELTSADILSIATRLCLTSAQRAAIEAMPEMAEIVSEHLKHARSDIKRSTLAEMLSDFPLPSIWASIALEDNPRVITRLLDYVTKARNEHPTLTGDDLLEMGMKKGPDVGDLLRYLRAGRLNGDLPTRDDEIKAVKSLMQMRTELDIELAENERASNQKEKN